jgi:oligopeptidase B
MNRRRTWRLYSILISLAFGLAVGQVGCRKAEPGPKPPVAERIPKEFREFGKTRVDHYYWLRERENPKVIEYLKAENDYLGAILKPTEPLQEKLYLEMVGRINPVDASVPYRDNGYYYYSRFEAGKEYPVYCRKKGSLDAPEEVLLDGSAMAEGQPFFSLLGLEVSPDNRLLAYAVDTVSRRLYRQGFKNLETGETLADAIPNTLGVSAWANDNKTVFYAMKDPVTLRPYQVMRHVLGTPGSEDVQVFREDDEAFNTMVYKSKSRKFIVIASESTLSTEYWLIDADRPESEPRVVQPRERDLEYQVEHFRDKLYIRTNLQAKNFRLVEAPLSQPAKEYWVEIIPHRDDVLFEGFEIFNDFLVVEERERGLTRIRAISWAGQSEHSVDFGESDYAAAIGQNPEFDSEWLRYEYSSLTTPDSVYDYNLKTHEKKLQKRQEVRGGFNPDNYQGERVYATASDGVKVPISLVYRKGLPKNGLNPLLEYGYGAYGAIEDPYFDSTLLSLLDRGFIYALVHIRGGSDLGRAWYEDGKLLKKKNTFTDFIACAEHLIAQKYTRPDRLFATGLSAGGLLMGAVVNMRPDLFKGVVAGVPYVDVITTMLDPEIPLTAQEFDEWGNPQTREYYDYMLSYSPYDNVGTKDYPAMLVTTGLHDSQVQYWEPAKWVAKLRSLKTDGNLLLLRTNMDAGHGGQSGRFRRFRETALEFAFLLDLAGVKE